MVLQRLAEKKLTRKQFCLQYNLSQSRLSEIITGNTPRNITAFRLKVARLLEIEEYCIEKYKREYAVCLRGGG